MTRTERAKRKSAVKGLLRMMKRRGIEYGDVMFKVLSDNDVSWIEGRSHQSGILIKRAHATFLGLVPETGKNDHRQISVNLFHDDENPWIGIAKAHSYGRGVRTERPELRITCLPMGPLSPKQGMLLVIAKCYEDERFDVAVVDPSVMTKAEWNDTLGGTFGITKEEAISTKDSCIAMSFIRSPEQNHWARGLSNITETISEIFKRIDEDASLLDGRSQFSEFVGKPFPTKLMASNDPSLLSQLVMDISHNIGIIHHRRRREKEKNDPSISYGDHVFSEMSMTNSSKNKGGEAFKLTISSVLKLADIPNQTEVTIGDERIDIMIGDLQIECKRTIRERWTQVHPRISDFCTTGIDINMKTLKKMDKEGVRRLIVLDHILDENPAWKRFPFVMGLSEFIHEMKCTQQSGT